MKKLFTVLFVLVMVFALAACGKTAAPAATQAPAAETQAPAAAAEAPEAADAAEAEVAAEEAVAEAEAAVGMPNPLVSCADAQELAEKTGISMPEVEGAENVTYTAIVAEGSASIAQMNFTLNGHDYCYRVQPTGDLELKDTDAFAGLYYEWNAGGQAEVSYNTANFYLAEDGHGYIVWLDKVPGLQYCLSSDKADADILTETANLLFVPAQGDS